MCIAWGLILWMEWLWIEYDGNGFHHLFIFYIGHVPSIANLCKNVFQGLGETLKMDENAIGKVFEMDEINKVGQWMDEPQEVHKALVFFWFFSQVVSFSSIVWLSHINFPLEFHRLFEYQRTHWVILFLHESIHCHTWVHTCFKV